MQDPNDKNRAFYWSTLLIRELYNHGVNHLFISPGSRSTPLVMAAAAHPGLNKRVILDERSSAFAALGAGKATGDPAALICTSGTAVANYYPAVIEARQSGVPLLVLTADRPPNLRNIGASQAIDQNRIFSGYPVFYHDAGEPAFDKTDLNRLRQAAGQAVTIARTRWGPSHINFPFRKPLEPEPAFVKKISAENRELADTRSPGTTVHTVSPAITGLNGIIGNRPCTKPLVVIGPMNPTDPIRSAVSLAEQLGAPLLAEVGTRPTDSHVSGFSGFLKNQQIRGKLAAGTIFRFGHMPVDKSLNLYLEELEGIPQYHFSLDEEWQDSVGTITDRILWDGSQPDLGELDIDTDPGWLNHWKQVERDFREYRKDLLQESPGLTDGAVFHRLGSQLEDPWNLFLSNSLPVRDMELFSSGWNNPTFLNRGASGIDGITSSAIGATITSNRTGILFIGDLAFLHDGNALLSARLLEEQSLVTIIINNRGGNIFRILPIHEHQEHYTHYFETPQQVEISQLARAHGIPYSRIETKEQLDSLDLADYANTPGLHLIECRTEPEASMELRRQMWEFSH